MLEGIFIDSCGKPSVGTRPVMDGRVKHVKFLVKLLFVDFMAISTIPFEMVFIVLIVPTVLIARVL